MQKENSSLEIRYKEIYCTELPRTKCIVRKDKVYVFESSKIVVLQKKTENSYGLQKKSVLQDTLANLTKMTIYM